MYHQPPHLIRKNRVQNINDQKIFHKENILIIKSEDALTLFGKRQLLIKILYFLSDGNNLPNEILDTILYESEETDLRGKQINSYLYKTSGSSNTNSKVMKKE